MDDLRKLRDKHSDELLSKRNVCGTAIGNKWVDGKPTDEPAILVFVQKKIRHDPNTIMAFAAGDLVPKKLEGVHTDVIEVGDIVKQTGFKQKVRPVRPGYSCGHEHVTAGTIGGIFLDKDGDLVVLTNNHVGANENKARPGDILFQPGMADQRKKAKYSGWAGNVSRYPYIGTLKKFVKIKGSGNTQDSAIIKIHPKLSAANMINAIYPVINKPLRGFADPKIKMQVQKCGRTTGYTTGQVIGLHASFTIGYDFGSAKFDDCVVVTAMSKGGDSGSIICDMKMNGVALLFAGSKKVTIANPLSRVVNQYGLQIWDGVGLKPPTVQNPGDILKLNSKHWRKFTMDGKLVLSGDGKKATITENGNHHCFLQCRLDEFNSVSCKVNTGSDISATWGPGIAVEWATGMMKVNLRNKTFGGYFNTNYNVNVGSVKPNTEYIVRIRKTSTSYVGEVLDKGKWYTVIELPRSVFPMDPSFLRIGKTGSLGGTRDHAKSGKAAGKIGTCTISHVKIT